MSEPRCFISYSWESESHKDWVRFFAEKLQDNGIFVHLDQWDISLGDDLLQYMETSIRESDYVLLICTPIFAEKANAGKGGVGYEKSIVTGEIFEKSVPNTKYVALIRAGDPRDALPSYLKSKAYIDFHNDDHFNQKIAELLRHLHKAPQFIRPPVGSKPAFKTQKEQGIKTQKVSDTSHEKLKTHLSSFKERFDFAIKSLYHNTSGAEQWARNNSDIDMQSFKERFDFAIKSLHHNTSGAEQWARENHKI